MRNQSTLIPRSIMAVLLVIAAAAGCGKDQKGSPSENEMTDVLNQLNQHRDEVCACGDKDCAMMAGERAAAFEQEVRQKFPNPSSDAKARFGRIATELKECLRRY